ncbi:hypothetical protein [Mangrovibrevibacter kandeliae]|uniref:hypothetical protein n=1 Tax=Mangrovibrevibacter kandeliae TaxID=2968473 RepID=UPI002118A994|nr:MULTISPECIES: hypothetical protein [unclassified Aurantimonas]MCQ8780772.1 hypothetical protein [Aurantimonas sp. CSK15Z-1]MCW4113555.1 hypothetical protein [Aurantimonas sp. MSK8Z-1]
MTHDENRPDRPSRAPVDRPGGLPVAVWMAIFVAVIAIGYFVLTGLYDYPEGAAEGTAPQQTSGDQAPR